MSGNVKNELLPIIVMNQDRKVIAFKRSWMDNSGTFVVDYNGTDFLLGRDDFLFFGKRAGGRYFITFDLQKRQTEYSMLTGAPTLKENTSPIEVKVTIGDKIAKLTRLDGKVVEPTAEEVPLPATDELEKDTNLLVKRLVKEGIQTGFRMIAEPVVGGNESLVESNIVPEVHDPDGKYTSGGLTFVLKEDPDPGTSPKVDYTKMKRYGFDESGNVIAIESPKQVLYGRFLAEVFDPDKGKHPLLVNPLTGDTIGIVELDVQHPNHARK